MIQNTHPRILLLAFLLSLFIPIIAYSKSCVNPINVVCPQMNCNVNVVYISQADIGPNGLVLDTPNTRYCFVESITWAPPTSLGRSLANPAAITINANNIELDLNGYTLQQSGSAINTVGIKIASPTDAILSNIIVSNGTVQNMASLGIYVDTVQNLLLQDLTVTNNGSAGSITTPYDLAGFVGGVAIVGPGNFYSISSASNLTRNIILQNVKALNNGGSSGAPTYGIAFDNGLDISIENSFANWNTSPNNGTAGFYLFNSDQCLLNSCQANDNNGANFAVGFYADTFSAQGFIDFNYCAAKGNNLAGIPIPAADQNYLFADGFYLHSVVPANLHNCIASYQGSNLTAANLPISANGFDLELAFDEHLTDCVAEYNGVNPFASPVASADFGRGFHISGSRTTLVNCFSNGNAGAQRGTQYDLENFVNFGTLIPDLTLPLGVTLRNCEAQGEAYYPSTYGIRIFNGVENIIENCTIELCTPDGILVDQAPGTSCIVSTDIATVGSTRNIIKHNQIRNTNALSPGETTGIWAIEDLSGTGSIGNNVPNNVYYDNYAYNYLGNVPGMENYNTGVRNAGGDDTTTYIITWNVPGVPPSSSLINKMSNYSILENCTGL